MAHKITQDCVACGTCLNECPVGAISEGDIYKIDPNVCIDCGTCADACPQGAIVAEYGSYPYEYAVVLKEDGTDAVLLFCLGRTFCSVRAASTGES